MTFNPSRHPRLRLDAALYKNSVQEYSSGTDGAVRLAAA
jgi:hypothetical protein